MLNKRILVICVELRTLLSIPKAYLAFLITTGLIYHATQIDKFNNMVCRSFAILRCCLFLYQVFLFFQHLFLGQELLSPVSDFAIPHIYERAEHQIKIVGKFQFPQPLIQTPSYASGLIVYLKYHCIQHDIKQQWRKHATLPISISDFNRLAVSTFMQYWAVDRVTVEFLYKFYDLLRYALIAFQALKQEVYPTRINFCKDCLIAPYSSTLTCFIDMCLLSQSNMQVLYDRVFI